MRPSARSGLLAAASVLFLAVTPVSAATPPHGAQVGLAGSISAHVIQLDSTDPLRFQLTVSNHTADAIHSIHLIRVSDGYELKRFCSVGDQGTEACKDAAEFGAGQNQMASLIKSGQSLTFWGELRPTAAHPSEGLSFVVGWTSGSPAPGLQSSALAELGENLVQSKSERTWAWIYGFAKIFGIPLALAGFGFVLNSISKRSTLRAETWKQLLPTSHKYAVKYYLPVSMAAQNLATMLEQPNSKLAFFYLLLLFRRMTDALKQIGGFYFKDIRGELLAAACWVGFKELLGKKDSEFCRSVLRSKDLVEFTDNYEQFLRKFEVTWRGQTEFANRDLQRCWILFCEVIKDDAKRSPAIQYLQAYFAILDFEANRPYKYWYSPNARLQVSANTKQLLKRISSEQKLGRFNTWSYLRRSVGPPETR